MRTLRSFEKNGFPTLSVILMMWMRKLRMDREETFSCSNIAPVIGLEKTCSISKFYSVFV